MKYYAIVKVKHDVVMQVIYVSKHDIKSKANLKDAQKAVAARFQGAPAIIGRMPASTLLDDKQPLEYD